MKPIDFSDLYISGDLYNRAQRLFERLHEDLYKPQQVFRDASYRWPGDNEGRTLLALALLARTINKKPKYLDEILSLLPEKINEKGYFGDILPQGCFDEQQMSSNSWVLRALIEYYQWKKDKKIYNLIKNIVNNLLLPLRGQLQTYPSHPKDRVFEGEASGGISGKVNNWYLSTDIGCIFIMLDGASHAYELFQTDELKALLEEMIQKFSSMNFLELSLQTHATLSALRGILRYYECVHDSGLLKICERIYEIYLKEAVTENYGNYNWFKRPTWTEPCAIIDSFMVGVNLWKNTGSSHYLDIAHNIRYNALGYSQRPNGGFGCDVCSGSENEFLYPLEGVFEATWCCTMRGGEGLSRMAQYSMFQEENEIIFPFYNDFTTHLLFDDGHAILKETTEYPFEGRTRIEVVYSDCINPKTIKLFLPEWVPVRDITLTFDDTELDYIVEDEFIITDIPLKTGGKLEFDFPIGLSTKSTINKNSIKGYFTFRHGYLVLGMHNTGNPVSIKKDALLYLDGGKYKVSDTEYILSPINDLMYMETHAAMKDRRQILFKE